MHKSLAYFKNVKFFLLLGILALVAYLIGYKYNLFSSYAFLNNRASFDIGQSLLEYKPSDTFWRAILVGFVNSIYVAVICIILSSILGFFIGLGRMSKNWLMSRICGAYVEVFRNIPLLLVILIFYFLILFLLPEVRNSYSWGDILFLSKRGFYFPNVPYLGVFLPLLIIITIILHYFLRPKVTGKGVWIFYLAELSFFILAIFLFCYFSAVELPKKSSFNILGGVRWTPEFLALVVGLSLYSAAFCAEIIRAGIMGVEKGYIEAGEALGLNYWQIKCKITMPIAFRIIIPPLTNSYVSLIKNTSLAVAIGFPDFVAVTSTILNQTGKAVEMVFLWFIVYGALSLLISFVMNWFNRKMVSTR